MHIEEVCLTKEYLLKIKNIDDTFYRNVILDIQWYLERYNEYHKGIILLDNNEVVGYLVAVPIKKEFYDAIINGVIINDLYINPKMFINDSNYKYVVSCVLLEKYRGKGYATQMMQKLFENAIGNYCALTITEYGYNLANKFMNLKQKINSDVSVFINS